MADKPAGVDVRTAGRLAGKILLAGRQRIHFCSRGAFRVHCKPHRPNHNPHDASGNVLRDLRVVFVGKLLSLDVVCLNLRLDHGAVALRILRLDYRDGMRITASARHQGEADDKCESTPERITNAPSVVTMILQLSRENKREGKRAAVLSHFRGLCPNLISRLS